MFNGIVAIIGRPNVGKSTLFNRLVGERISIVFDEPGVTRDRIYGQVKWLDREFRLIDTGGLARSHDFFQEKIRIQADIAINEADVIIFLVDAQVGLLEDDQYIAKLLHRSQKKVILAINKSDSIEVVNDNYEFQQLGFADYFFISSAHGIGTGDLLDKVVTSLPTTNTELLEKDFSIAIIGRPNVGKSSLLNAITNNERVIVSDIPGTTRDAIDTLITLDDKKYLLIDTAGLHRRGKFLESVDRYSAFRSLDAIDRSDICLLVIDASEGFLEEDKHILNHAIEGGKGAIFVVNKWDLGKKQTSKEEFSRFLHSSLPFLAYIPIVYISALHKSGLNDLFSIVDVVGESRQTKVTTTTLNEVILDAQMINPPPTYNGGNLKIYYSIQQNTAPPEFTIFVNNPDYMHFSYQRFLENRIREAYNFVGTPLRFKIRRKT